MEEMSKEQLDDIRDRISETIKSGGKLVSDRWAKEVLSEAPKYVFNDDKLIAEFKEYVDDTYKGHYAGEGDDVQAFQLMLNDPYAALCFARYSALKYAARFGKKKGHNRDDIMKIMHFGMLALAAFDKWQHKEKRANEVSNVVEKQKVVDQINADALANLSGSFTQIYHESTDK